ncbi:hypothetical protein Pelo_19438 [Pelomyxa schiedti]|nr:hypothetical protein Pelo_19438 [Pelomyxa schiedti]
MLRSAGARAPHTFNYIAQHMSPQLLQCVLGSALISSCGSGNLSPSRSIATKAIMNVKWLSECNDNEGVGAAFLESCSH